MKAMLQGVKANGEFVNLIADDNGYLKIMVCGVDSQGNVRPLECDDEGRLIIAP